MESNELRILSLRVDMLRDVVTELVAALPPDRGATFVTAIGTRLNDRMSQIKIDECTDDAMVSDLALVLAAISRRPDEPRNPAARGA